MATAKKGGSKTGAKKGAAKKGAAKKGAAKKATARGAGAKSATKKSAAKKGGAAKKGAAKKATKRAPNPAFMKPMQPDEQLGAVIGSSPMPRTEVTKRLWAYIKKNGLQDGRTINADDKLRTLFGGKKSVTMFELTSIASKHLKPA
jgi:chromatin remodeling complex protein RSC6